MDVFSLDRALVGDYEQFARSFTQIRAADIRDQVDELYAGRRFWPDPLVTINPHFERDVSVAQLATTGDLAGVVKFSDSELSGEGRPSSSTQLSR